MTTRTGNDGGPTPDRLAGMFLLAAMWLLGSPRRAARA